MAIVLTADLPGCGLRCYWPVCFWGSCLDTAGWEIHNEKMKE